MWFLKYVRAAIGVHKHHFLAKKHYRFADEHWALYCKACKELGKDLPKKPSRPKNQRKQSSKIPKPESTPTVTSESTPQEVPNDKLEAKADGNQQPLENGAVTEGSEPNKTA